MKSLFGSGHGGGLRTVVLRGRGAVGKMTGEPGAGAASWILFAPRPSYTPHSLDGLLPRVRRPHPTRSVGGGSAHGAARARLDCRARQAGDGDARPGGRAGGRSRKHLPDRPARARAAHPRRPAHLRGHPVPRRRTRGGSTSGGLSTSLVVVSLLVYAFATAPSWASCFAWGATGGAALVARGSWKRRLPVLLFAIGMIVFVTQYGYPVALFIAHFPERLRAGRHLAMAGRQEEAVRVHPGRSSTRSRRRSSSRAASSRLSGPRAARRSRRSSSTSTTRA